MTKPDVRFEDSTICVAMNGNLTFQTYLDSDKLVDQITAMLTPAEGKVEKIRFDLSEVPMIDSHWLGTFVRVLGRAEKHKIPVVLARLQPPVRRLVELVQFGRVFTIED